MLIRKKNIALIIFITLIIITFISVNISVRLLGSELKADMTSNKRYSLSPASKDIIATITSPVQIRVYLSSALTQENPSYASYAQFVVRFLKKYQLQAGRDKIKLEIIDPRPYSSEEDDAKKIGIKPFPDASGQSNLYFGAIISNTFGKSAIIPNFIPSRSGYLETDISRILSKLTNGNLKNIGLITPQLPLITKAYGQSVPNWAIVAQIQNDYNIIELNDRISQIPNNIDVLVLINPQRQSPLLTYALDQYLLRGGNILIINDIFSEKQASLKGTLNASSADMNKLFQNWGFSLPNDTIVGDRNLGELTLISNSNGQQTKNFPYWLQLEEKQINQSHHATHGLTHIRLKTSGIITPKEDNPQIKFTPLLTTTNKANLVEKSSFTQNNQTQLESLFRDGDTQYVLAAEIEGKFPSLFAQNIMAGTKYEKQMPTFLPYSIAQGKIIVLADSDFLVAENWADTSETMNNPVYGLAPLYDNGTLILRFLDYLTGKNSLLGINNKHPLNTKTVGENIYIKTFNKYAETYNQALTELNQRQAWEKTQNITPLNSTATPLTAQQLQAMETNAQRIKDLQKEINKITYQIKEENAQKINEIIRLNIIYIPLVTILFILCIYIISRRRSNKRVEEIANELQSN